MYHLPEDDWRKHDPRFNEPQLSRNVGLRRPDQIDPILTGGNLELTNGDVAEIEGSTP
jgi:hypothetical protein